MNEPVAHPPPEQIGKYQVLRKLGEGATSEVYLCHDPFAERDVAVKVVFGDRCNDPSAASCSASCSSPRPRSPASCAPAHRADLRRGRRRPDVSYIVMEYVDGGTLEPYCEAGAAPADRQDRRDRLQVHAARSISPTRQGVTHRDIKPANILLAGETDIKISDFGAALITTADTTQVSGIGSPAYMSPQQVKEHPLDHQTDIYSLGVVMYQLLTGRLPFQARNNFSHDVPDHQRRAAAALVAAQRRSRARSTTSCARRCRRTSSGATRPGRSSRSTSPMRVRQGTLVDAPAGSRRHREVQHPARHCRSSTTSPTPNSGR